MVYYVEDVPAAWSYPENIKSIEIDSGIGLSFEAKMEDLNADGKFIASKVFGDLKGRDHVFRNTYVNYSNFLSQACIRRIDTTCRIYDFKKFTTTVKV